MSPACFEALHRLSAVRKANRICELATQSLFPLAEQMLQVESMYGESISMEDIDGRKSTGRKSRTSSREEKVTGAVPIADGVAQSGEFKGTSPLVTVTMMEGTEKGDNHKPVAKLKAATDSSNPSFDASRANYSPPDFLAEQRDALELTLKNFEESKRQREADRAADSVPAKFVYSGQKLQVSPIHASSSS